MTTRDDLATDEQKDMRGISRCWQWGGWHVYKAGPCFDTHEQALAYRTSLDAEGVTWRPQP